MDGCWRSLAPDRIPSWTCLGELLVAEVSSYLWIASLSRSVEVLAGTWIVDSFVYDRSGRFFQKLLKLLVIPINKMLRI